MNISQHSDEDDFLKQFLDEFFDFGDESNFMESSNSLLGDDLQHVDLSSNTPFGNSQPLTATSQSTDASFLPFEVSFLCMYVCICLYCLTGILSK